MSKTFNIYCDESCHLEHDHKLYMFLGSVSCAFPQVQVHSRQIMERLFRHLTTCITDKATQHREFEMARSLLLHWIRHLVEKRKRDNMYVFSVDEPRCGIRTYIYDKDENYVIVLEPLRNGTEYYLLTAYYLEGKDTARDKMMRKYKRRLPNIA